MGRRSGTLDKARRAIRTVLQQLRLIGLFGIMLIAVLSIAANWRINPQLSLGARTVPLINTIDTIATDMSLPHDGQPRGIKKDLDWFSGPRIGMGNDPGSFTAMTAWGQLYEPVAGNPAHNTRVQIRNMKTYLLSRQDAQWHLIQDSPQVEGAAYREDYVDNVNRKADIRQEAQESISVSLEHGYNFHFWPKTGRAAIAPDSIAGIFTTVQARLVLDDPKGPDDRAQARYLLSMGGDYWLDTRAQWDDWKTNGDIAMGRFKWVEPRWKAFNMTTLTRKEMHQNSPPLE